MAVELGGRALRAARLSAFFGSASLLAIAACIPAYGQSQSATTASSSIPEEVVVTGSLIHGTPAVGVPVTTLSAQDFKLTGALTTADLLKNFRGLRSGI